MKTLYVIPARGGSKGIPGKNIKPLCGKPLIAYSIEVARALADDCDICLSTDSQQIADVAKNMGLEVPFMRPDYLATDKSGTYEVLLHAVQFYAEQGISYDTMVLLQPTSPLRTADDVSRALALYTAEVDMVVTVCLAAANPYYNLFETTADGFLTISKGDGLLTRRQDAPRVWEYNGAVYVINPQSLRRCGLGAFARRVPCEMPRSRSIDLDTMQDWALAELLMQSPTATR